MTEPILTYGTTAGGDPAVMMAGKALLSRPDYGSVPLLRTWHWRLTQDEVRAMLPYLERFVETGELTVAPVVR